MRRRRRFTTPEGSPWHRREPLPGATRRRHARRRQVPRHVRLPPGVAGPGKHVLRELRRRAAAGAGGQQRQRQHRRRRQLPEEETGRRKGERDLCIGCKEFSYYPTEYLTGLCMYLCQGESNSICKRQRGKQQQQQQPCHPDQMAAAVGKGRPERARPGAKKKAEVASPKDSPATSASTVTAGQKTDYIHVRARRGQATDSHSLAERVRHRHWSCLHLASLLRGES